MAEQVLELLLKQVLEGKSDSQIVVVGKAVGISGFISQVLESVIKYCDIIARVRIIVGPIAFPVAFRSWMSSHILI